MPRAWWMAAVYDWPVLAIAMVVSMSKLINTLETDGCRGNSLVEPIKAIIICMYHLKMSTLLLDASSLDGRGPFNRICIRPRCRWWVIIDGMAVRLLNAAPDAHING